MTDSPKRTTSSRALILVLALGLVVMLATSLKERFESPGLTEQRRPGPAAQAGRQDDDAQQSQHRRFIEPTIEHVTAAVLAAGKALLENFERRLARRSVGRTAMVGAAKPADEQE